MYIIRYIILWMMLFLTLLYYNVPVIGQFIVYVIVVCNGLNEVHRFYKELRDI